MSLHEEFEKYLMQTTNLSRNELRGRLSDVLGAGKNVVDRKPTEIRELGPRNDIFMRITESRTEDPVGEQATTANVSPQSCSTPEIDNLPEKPTVDGDYLLLLNKSGSTITLSWEKIESCP